MIDNTVLVAIFSLIGTFVGSIGGILAANKLTNYRIGQLEKKVEKHNNVIERMFELEKHEEITDEKIRNIDHRVDHLESYHN